jgi:hypothetical protein
MPEQSSIAGQALAQKKFSCPACGGEMIQKSKVKLIMVGLCMLASVVIAFLVRWFWAPGIILALAGIYLLVWATLGKARWCRSCKKFSFQHH